MPQIILYFLLLYVCILSSVRCRCFPIVKAELQSKAVEKKLHQDLIAHL